MTGGRHLVLAAIDEVVRPISIRTLGAYAESMGVKTTLLVAIKDPAQLGRPITFTSSEVSLLCEWLAKERVTHMGFYLMSSSLHPYAMLVRMLREGGYRGMIFAGGVHATLCPEESLVDGADFAVQGPGELPLRMILEGAASSSIPGLVWKCGDKVVVNDKSDAQKIDLDSLPYPIFRFDRDMLMVDGKLKTLTWTMHRKHSRWGGRYYDMLTSRGCVYHCAYCCNVNGAPVRRESVDRVIGELKYVRRQAPGIAGVNFQDDNFCSGTETWMKEFCSRMRPDVGLPFIVRMIPRYVTKERVEMLKSAGLEYITMGLEGSDRINRSVYNRNETAQSFLRAARVILESGVYLSIDIIINNPYEKEEDLRQIATTLNSLPKSNWAVVALPLTAFPNTALHAKCKRDNMLRRLVTDPYESMLVVSQRQDGYLTPRFWLLLNTEILPAIPQDLGDELIKAGPLDPKAAEKVERLASRLGSVRKVTTWLGKYASWLKPIARVMLKKSIAKRKQK